MQDRGQSGEHWIICEKLEIESGALAPDFFSAPRCLKENESKDFPIKIVGIFFSLSGFIRYAFL